MAVGSSVRVWATAISAHAQNGRKIFFRYAKELNLAFDPASQPFRIIIVWKYESETGQPFTDDHQRMNELEDLLEAALNRDRFATLALVSTGEGLREWTYYTQGRIRGASKLRVCGNARVSHRNSHSIRSRMARIRGIQSWC